MLQLLNFKFDLTIVLSLIIQDSNPLNFYCPWQTTLWVKISTLSQKTFDYWSNVRDKVEKIALLGREFVMSGPKA
jgi:hypothetical protein